MTFGRAFRLVAILLGAVTVILAVICGVMVVRTQAFLAASSTTSGQVIGLVPRQSCDTDDDGDRSCSTVYAPRVRFTTADGQQVVFVSDTASNPPEHEEGDRIDVRYRTNDPKDAVVDSVTGIWLGEIITGGLTAVFAAMCAVWVVLARRFRNE
jgi:preprotein translocase subunit SecF